MRITIERAILFDMETTTMTKNFNRGNYGNRNYQSGPYVQPQNWEVAPRDS